MTITQAIETGDPCRDCRRPLRARSATKKDYPGTMRHSGRGLCEPCHKIRTANGTLDQVKTFHFKALNPCHDCGIKLRSTNTLVADAPGTREHVGRGLCERCHSKRRRRDARELKPMPPQPVRDPVLHIYLQHDEPNVQRTASAARAFILERRSRGVPVEGIGWREEEVSGY